MKIIFLLALLFIGVACGSTQEIKQQQTPNDELRADVLVRSTDGKSLIEITFYRATAVAPGNRTNEGSGKNVVAVFDPLFNGVAMTTATNLSGQPIYRVEPGSTKAENVITASIGGQTYEGKTLLETKLKNKMTTVFLNPVRKSGS
ncbi:MAG: hypothetical protein ABIU09_00875 [Pyrinomonadaceae bacterium]